MLTTNDVYLNLSGYLRPISIKRRPSLRNDAELAGRTTEAVVLSVTLRQGPGGPPSMPRGISTVSRSPKLLPNPKIHTFACQFRVVSNWCHHFRAFRPRIYLLSTWFTQPYIQTIGIHTLKLFQVPSCRFLTLQVHMVVYNLCSSKPAPGSTVKSGHKRDGGLLHFLKHREPQRPRCST